MWDFCDAFLIIEHRGDEIADSKQWWEWFEQGVGTDGGEAQVSGTHLLHNKVFLATTSGTAQLPIHPALLNFFSQEATSEKSTSWQPNLNHRGTK